MPARKDITGQTFGRLTALRYIGDRKYVWKCSCGSERPHSAWPIVSGSIKSCGCEKDAHKIKHGFRPKGTAQGVYAVWQSMVQRCHSPTSQAYARYGARGIFVCDRWRDFKNFLEDMGEPHRGMTLDRIDNNGPYSPENCRWVSMKAQSNNRSSNRIISLNGQSLNATEWAEKLGLKRSTIYKRVSAGLSAEDILRPPNARNSK